MAFDIKTIQKDFSVLETKVHGKSLIYLDSAATALKPKSVIESIMKYYSNETASVHRGIHFLSNQATEAFEKSRTIVQNFLGANEDEIVFTHGTTESVNIVANGFSQALLKSDDEIILTELEHHSNLVPWQMAAERAGAKIKYLPINEKGELIIEELEKLITNKTKIMSVTAVSNTLGTINPIKEIVKICHAKNVLVMVDAAQAVANMPINVKDWDCDFLAFSGHKIFGPTGVGVLYGKKEFLNKLPPLLGGGAMIDKVTLEKTTYLEAPFRFEAGTPHISGVIGLGTALEYVSNLGFKNIIEHENDLLNYATEQLCDIKKLKIIGTAKSKVAIISFNIEGLHHQDVGSLVDHEGVAIRTGHHCTQPLMTKLGITGTARASFSIYSTKSDVDRLRAAIEKAIYIAG